MRENPGLRQIAAIILFFTAALVRAQCVSSIQTVTQPSVFPSRVPGPIATNGDILSIAKTDTSTSFPAIFSSVYDSNLTQILADRQIAATSLHGPVALFYAKSLLTQPVLDRFGLFYQRPDATLVLQSLSVDGASPLGAPVTMSHSWSFNDDFDITWDESAHAYAIAHVVTGGRDLGLWLTMVDPAGNVISDLNLSVFAGSQSFPRVTALADGTVAVLWSRASTPPVISLSFVKGTDVNTAVITNSAINAPKIASDGTSVLVIYSSAKTGGGTELRSIMVDASAHVTIPDSSLMSGSGEDIAPLWLIWNPTLSEWVLGYLDAFSGFRFFSDTRLRRFTSVDATPSDTLLSPDPARSRLSAPFPVVFINNSYIGAIENVISTTQGSESYLVKDCPFVAKASADHPVWRPFLPVTFTATGGGGTPGYTYGWQFGDLASASGATVQHIYQIPGTYTVTLTGTDAAGAKSISKITVQITNSLRERVVHH